MKLSTGYLSLMNIRYASVILLLSSALIGGGWLLFSQSSLGFSRVDDGRVSIIVASPPLAAAIRDFVDPNAVRVEALLDPSADMHHTHFSPSQLRRVAAADIARVPMLEDDYVPAEDPHIWFYQNQLAEFVLAVAAQLDDESRAAANYVLAARAHWLADEQQKFAPVANTPFITDHDAFIGFEQELGLTGKLGALTTGHDQAIGAKSLRELRAKAAGKNICVLHGPHANTKRIATMLEGATLHFTEADPLLWNDPIYASGMQRLADAFYECLTKAAR